MFGRSADVRRSNWRHDSVASTQSGQTNPSKTKPDQIRPSKIAWFYLVLFVRIGTFQWVTANPNRIFLPLSHCASNVTVAFSLPVLPRGAAAKRSSIRRTVRYTIDFGFTQEIARFFFFLVSAGAG